MAPGGSSGDEDKNIFKNAGRILRMYSAPGTSSASERHELLPRFTKPKKNWKALLWTGSYTVMRTKLNFLLFFMPVGLLFHYGFRHIPYFEKHERVVDGFVFVSSILVLCPLAERLGFITEELALYTNDTFGGLLNASFGNATELIICGFALGKARTRGKSYLRIVQLSLLGSVLGNLLLVLGSAFLVGGLAHPMQSFNQQGAAVSNGLLLMAVGSVLLPTTLAATHTQHCERDAQDPCNQSELTLSRFESLFMLGAYTLYLIFQLCTHTHLYEGNEAEDEETPNAVDSTQTGDGKVADPATLTISSIDSRGSTKRSAVATGHRSSNVDIGFAPAASLARVTINSEIDEVEEEEPVLGLQGSIIWLTIATVFIALFSEMAVDTIEAASHGLNIPMPFLSTIILPIVGNAAEHASAIMFAYKNRMEVTMGVAVGSSTQIAVFVIPFTVVLGWSMGEELDLNFELFEAFTLFIAVLLTVVSMNDGTSNWLKGAILVLTYIFISAAFWVHDDKALDGRES